MSCPATCLVTKVRALLALAFLPESFDCFATDSLAASFCREITVIAATAIIAAAMIANTDKRRNRLVGLLFSIECLLMQASSLRSTYGSRISIKLARTCLWIRKCFDDVRNQSI